MDSQRTSFYIPAIGYVSENRIKNIFWDNKIGTVKRVDYFENTKGVWCVFVHFSNWVENEDTQHIWEQINRHGSYKFWFNDYEYLILRKMTCPEIPETSMNIHQIAGKIWELEKRVSVHFNILFKLIATVGNRFNNNNNNNNNYSHSNSIGVTAKTDESISELDTGMILSCSESDKSYDNGYDYNYSYNYESRMKKTAESMVDSLVGPRWTDEDDLDSKSNIFIVATDSDSDGSNNSSSNRMRFTAEFCDNE